VLFGIQLLLYEKYGLKFYSTKNGQVVLSGENFASKAGQIFEERDTSELDALQNGSKLPYTLE
jgi:hypothetical protein